MQQNADATYFDDEYRFSFYQGAKTIHVTGITQDGEKAHTRSYPKDQAMQVVGTIMFSRAAREEFFNVA